MIVDRSLQKAERGLKTGESAFLESLQTELFNLDQELTAFTFENRMLVIGNIEKMQDTEQRHRFLKRDINGLLDSLEMFIKRNLYTNSRKKELEATKEKIVKMKEIQDNTKVNRFKTARPHYF